MCILTSIWVLRASKSWSKHFFQSFPTFFVHVRDFTSQIKKKCLKYKSIFKIFVYSSKLVDMQKLVDSLRGHLEFVFFRLIFYWKRFRMNQKGWKRLKKEFWPAFECKQHLKASRNTQHLTIIMTIWIPDHWKTGRISPDFKRFLTKWQPFVPISDSHYVLSS